MKKWIVAEPEHLGRSPRVHGALAELAHQKELQPA
jgi:hypothetical protein